MKKVILKRHFFAEKFGGFKKKHYLCTRFRDNQSTGEMVEWSITVVLKTTVPRGTGGSNPSLSANIAENQQVTNLHPDLHPLLVNLGVILHPLLGAPLIDDMLKALKF